MLGLLNARKRDGNKFEIGWIDVHPERKHSIMGNNDIAIITLKRNITFSETIKPICLASQYDNLVPGEQVNFVKTYLF